MQLEFSDGPAISNSKEPTVTAMLHPRGSSALAEDPRGSESNQLFSYLLTASPHFSANNKVCSSKTKNNACFLMALLGFIEQQ
ncbi:hypothetical protein WH43_04420 [Rheinheimera sp. KL1]|nr:hypothetical protein WH43_04420 [Rheinheimera sp. KL1]